MKVFCEKNDDILKFNKKTVVTIGNFDGLHTGHISLIKKVMTYKEKYNLESVVLTFDVNTKSKNDCIFSRNNLEKALENYNIDYIVKLTFSNELKNMSCEDFVKKYLINLLNCEYVVVGDNFYFGKNRSGNIDTLCELGEKYGFKCDSTGLLKYDNTTISSTYIRELIKNGNVKKANMFLKNPFCIFGEVVSGYGAGSRIFNIPTANILLNDGIVIPKLGVYAVNVIIDNICYKGVTNIGYAPTLPKEKPLAETFILDFNKNIYKKNIKIEFIEFIREEKKFDNFEQLKKQILCDVNYRKGII